MRLSIRLLERSGTHMRVNLSRDQTLMPKHFLHTSDIRTAIQQMRCETVTKRVRCCARIQATLLNVFFQHARDTASR